MNTRSWLPRRSWRHAIELPATIRWPTALRMRGVITNLSEHGCVISAIFIPSMVGKRISIQPYGMEVLSGIVVWSRTNEIGVDFEHPLYPPVLDHLLRNYAPLGQSGIL